VKIGITREGFYRVSRAELQSAGFDVNASPALWQLYVNGIQQSINVGDNGAYIEFYGRGIDTPETNTQIYYLVVGAQNGKRIGRTIRRQIGGQVLSSNFSQSLTKKERKSYTTLVLNGDAENFFGTVINGTPATVSFNLPSVDFTVANASIDIGIQGLTDAPSHQTKVLLNGVDIGAISGSIRDLATRHYNIPTSLLRAGTNTLQLTALNARDVSLFESVKVSYGRQYQAEQNQLSFYTNNYRASYLGGFSSSNIRVFDVTYPDSPTVISGLSIEANSGGYRVFLPASRGRVMYAVEDSAVLQAASITLNAPSTLSTPTHNANLIIISYKDWMTQANDWADYRRSQGFSVEVVNIEDVFDEFNFGAINSLSIRSFLQYAKGNWQTAPRYVLLIGDTTYDPKDYGENGNFNFVPTKMLDTIYGEIPSDDTLADFNDDGLAEIAIGRAPARSSTDVTQLLNKTKIFEQTSAQGFSRGTIFASDVPLGWDFEATSNKLRDLLPTGTTSITVNRAESGAKTRLLNEMNNGRFFINYAGHGSSGAWASNSFFGKADAAVLTNGNNLSVFTLLTCLNGYFIQPNVVDDSLAEVLLKAQNGGAAAVWASTGETTPDIQEIMATRFYQQLTLGNIKRLGDLANDAKTTINAGRDVRLSWVLLGDPMLKVR
jgi:Peptidase family C25